MKRLFILMLLTSSYLLASEPKQVTCDGADSIYSYQLRADLSNNTVDIKRTDTTPPQDWKPLYNTETFCEFTVPAKVTCPFNRYGNENFFGIDLACTDTQGIQVSYGNFEFTYKEGAGMLKCGYMDPTYDLVLSNCKSGN